MELKYSLFYSSKIFKLGVYKPGVAVHRKPKNTQVQTA